MHCVRMCVHGCIFCSSGAGLNHEQLAELRDLLSADGRGSQGHSLPAADKAAALLQVHAVMGLGHSFDAAVKTTAGAMLASPNTVRAAAKELSASGTIAEPHTKDGRRSNPQHPFYCGESGPSLAAELVIHRLLDDVKQQNTFESCHTLCLALAAELNVVVSKSTMHRWLHSLGYVYRNKHFIKTATSSYRHCLIRGFIYKYAKALKEQEDGTAIIVFMDESYIHSHHCSKKLWFSLSSPTKNDVRGDDRGKRIIIMHAMTKDGLLEVEAILAAHRAAHVIHRLHDDLPAIAQHQLIKFQFGHKSF